MKTESSVDLAVLTDIISNVVGMTILLACVALLFRQKTLGESAGENLAAKPISFPLAYVPEKRSLTLVLKHDRLYELPEKELLEAVTEKVVDHEPVAWLRLEKDGVDGEIHLTSTATGFRFMYKIKPAGGVLLDSTPLLVKTIDAIISKFPPERFFYVFHTWPECFSQFREIREYLIEQGGEVGWHPRAENREKYDVIYSIGEYDESLSTIKAQ